MATDSQHKGKAMLVNTSTDKAVSQTAANLSSIATAREYTCPMHPQIVRSEPGSCPICGMALEPMAISVDEERNPELEDRKRRFRVSLLLTVPVLIAAMGEMIPGQPLRRLASQRVWTWFE